MFTDQWQDGREEEEEKDKEDGFLWMKLLNSLNNITIILLFTLLLMSAIGLCPISYLCLYL